MAYGKSEDALNKVVPYGGSMSQRAKNFNRQQQQARENRSTSLSDGHWTNTLTLPTTHTRIVRLIPGNYTQTYSVDGVNMHTEVFEYYMFIEHFHRASMKSCVCCAGPLYRSKENAEPCYGCQLFWEDYRERQAKKSRGDRSDGPNRISMRDLYAFTVWDYGLWINAPKTDKYGVTKTNKEGKAYFDLTPAQQGDPRTAMFEHKYGHLLVWPMSRTFKDTLMSYSDETIQHDCATCGTPGAIKCVARICGNPQCEAEVFDPLNTTLSPEQQENLLSSPYKCPVCGETSYINELIECDTCLERGTVPRRANIFDVDLVVKAVPTKGQQTMLQILNRSAPRPIQIADPAVVATIKPFDLVSKYKPTSIEKQHQLFGMSQQLYQQQITQMQQMPEVYQQQVPPMYQQGPWRFPQHQQHTQQVPQPLQEQSMLQPQLAMQPVLQHPVQSHMLTPLQVPGNNFNK